MADEKRTRKISGMIDNITTICEEILPEERDELAQIFLTNGQTIYQDGIVEVKVLLCKIGYIFQILAPKGADMKLNEPHIGDDVLIRLGRISDGLWMKPIILDRGEWFEVVQTEIKLGEKVTLNIAINGNPIAATFVPE